MLKNSPFTVLELLKPIHQPEVTEELPRASLFHGLFILAKATALRAIRLVSQIMLIRNHKLKGRQELLKNGTKSTGNFILGHRLANYKKQHTNLEVCDGQANSPCKVVNVQQMTFMLSQSHQKMVNLLSLLYIKQKSVTHTFLRFP